MVAVKEEGFEFGGGETLFCGDTLGWVSEEVEIHFVIQVSRFCCFIFECVEEHFQFVFKAYIQLFFYSMCGFKNCNFFLFCFFTRLSCSLKIL